MAKNKKQGNGKAQKTVDKAPAPTVESVPASNAGAEAPQEAKKTMTLTLRQLSQDGKAAYYGGAAVVIRVATSVFPGGTAPQSFEVPEGVFAPAKPKLTPEQRKEARKNAPKPTLAEKIAKREQQLARLREQASREQASQPSA